MPITPIQGSLASYGQILSMALEERSSGYQDLVSNNNALLALMRRKGLWQTYSGPRIRQTLQIANAAAQWYSGFDTLTLTALDLFADAYFEPKQVVVPISLHYAEILNNSGENQLLDVLDQYVEAAERSLEDAMDTALYGDGITPAKSLSGLGAAVPIDPTLGIYGGINRATAGNELWRTTTYNAHTYFASFPPINTTQVTSASIRPMLNHIMTLHSRGKDHADLLIMSPEHYAAYDAATLAIQRQHNETSLGRLGFSALEYIGGGKRAEIVLDGGIGSNIPANTTFGLDTGSFRLRYHPSRNFDKLFDGDGQQPINQDAIAQYIGWMGELTMTNPLFNWRFYDPTPGS